MYLLDANILIKLHDEKVDISEIKNRISTSDVVKNECIKHSFETGKITFEERLKLEEFLNNIKIIKIEDYIEFLEECYKTIKPDVRMERGFGELSLFAIFKKNSNLKIVSNDKGIPSDVPIIRYEEFMKELEINS